MPTNNDLTPEQIAEVQAKLLQSCNGHPNAEISWPHYILHQAHAAIEQLQRQLTDAEKREHKLMIDFGMKCNELAEASLLSSGLNDAVQGRTQSLAEIERSLRPQPTVLSQATLRIHDSPESAFSALYDVNFAEIDSIGGVDEKGEETECNPKDAMDGMRQMGLWGCCPTDSATVHVWASPEASDSYLLMLLG